MKLYSGALLAAVVAGTAALEYGAMPTRPAVLQEREPDCVEDSCLSGGLLTLHVLC